VNLEPVNLEPVNLEPVNLEPVNLEPVNLEPVNLEPVNFASRKLRLRVRTRAESLQGSGNRRFTQAAGADSSVALT